MSFKVVSKAKPQHYSEVGQVRNCFFSFAIQDKKDKSVVYLQHKPVKCRDFLNDTLVWRKQLQEHGKVLDNGRYWGYDYKEDIDTENTRFLITDFGGLVENAKLLNKLETDAGYSPTTVSVSADKQYAMTVGDKRWMDNTVASSFYTYLLRMFTYGKMSSEMELFKTNDPWINTALKDTVFKFPKAISLLPKKDVRGSTMTSMHDHNGFFTALRTPQFNIYGEDLNNALSKL